MGDFNISADRDIIRTKTKLGVGETPIDIIPYKPAKNKPSNILQKLEAQSMCDTYRTLNPENGYTSQKKESFYINSRIDYVFTSAKITQLIIKSFKCN